MPLSKTCAIGLDLGGTNLKFGLIDDGGGILFQEVLPARSLEGAKAVMDTMIKATSQAIRFAEKSGLNVSAIGAGCPGNIDGNRGISLAPTPHIPDWEGAEIGPVLERKTGMRVSVDNDANCMTLAESIVGAAKNCRHVIGLTLGTGVGGGIVMDRRIFHGSAFNAGELGHVSIEMDGRPCSCGNLGCVERYAGARYIVEDVIKALESGESSIITQGLSSYDHITPPLIFSAAGYGDELCGRIVQQMIRSLAAAITSMVNVLNPEMVVIGGGMADAGNGFIQRIDAEVRTRVMKPDRARLKVVKAQLGNNAGMIGAALNAMEYHDKA